jgi:17beta-estradiol 17-dehydrogenase / very-long-chain 3-oxoacyl-CoA reductase
MVINNVGVDVLEYYHKLPPKEITHLIKLNCFPCTMLCHYFIPIMLKRTQETRKKCALVNVSSVAGIIPMPLHNIYSASKAYVDRFTTTLQYEYPDLDIVALRPSEVSTPMTCNKEIDVFTITTEQCANGLLDNLGHEKQTYGHWRHKLQGWLYENVPESLFNYIFLHYVGPDFMKQRSEAQKKSH